MKKTIYIVFTLFVLFTHSCQSEDRMLELEKDYTSIINNDVQGKSSLMSSTEYGVNEVILGQFIHYCQRQAGPSSSTYPTAENKISLSDAMNACCPTSYMMAAACLAHHKYGSITTYNATGAKLASIIAAKPYPLYTQLLKMNEYANTTDASFLASNSCIEQADRNAMKNFIQTSLSLNRFVLVAVNASINSYNIVNDARLYQNNTTNPDLSLTNSLYISENSISSSSDLGSHIILLIKVTIDATGDGVVQYIDPLAVTKSGSNRRYVRYSKLLNSMKINGTPTTYSAISVGLY